MADIASARPVLNPDELQEIVALCDSDGIILFWNRAGHEVTGFSAEEVVGYHLDSVVAPDCQDELGQILQVRKTGTILPGLPLRLTTSFGMQVPVDVTSLPRYREGAFDGWLLVFRDTTLKAQLQEQLDTLDVLYRSLVENSPAIIYVLDPDGRLVFINDTVEHLLGYPKAELLGRELIELVHPEDKERAYWPLRERRRFPRATRNLELRMRTKLGVQRQYDLEFVHLSLNSVGLKGQMPQGHTSAPLGTQGIARDVTELVRLREFSQQVESILPICSVCRKIRVSARGTDEWVPLDLYIGSMTTTRFSHTYCPEHVPRPE
jgi:PAS domain S-box-containing protein